MIVGRMGLDFCLRTTPGRASASVVTKVLLSSIGWHGRLLAFPCGLNSDCVLCSGREWAMGAR